MIFWAWGIKLIVLKLHSHLGTLLFQLVGMITGCMYRFKTVRVCSVMRLSACIEFQLIYQQFWLLLVAYHFYINSAFSNSACNIRFRFYLIRGGQGCNRGWKVEGIKVWVPTPGRLRSAPAKGRAGYWVRQGVAPFRCDGPGVSPPESLWKLRC